MATKSYVVVEVLTEGTGEKAEFLSVKVEGGQPIPIPKDVPAPRRLVQNLLEAALDAKHPANVTHAEVARREAAAKAKADEEDKA